MFLDVSKALRSPGTPIPFQLTLEIPAQDVLGEEITFDSLQIEGYSEGVGESIILDGKLKTTAHAPCANCLAPAQAELEVPFRETFVHGAQPDDPDVFSYEELSEFIGKVKIDRAKELLRNSDIPVEDISGKLGFSSPAYFGKVFKKIVGTSPLKYRKTSVTKL